jgi:diamine N-acetyltransferase
VAYGIAGCNPVGWRRRPRATPTSRPTKSTRTPRSDDELAFVVYERATRRPIGLTGLRHINHVHRTAEFGIGIGEPDCRGKGYGTEATRLVLDYAFTLLGLHNVWLRVFAYNEWAIRAYRRAGFKELGRRREAHRVGGRAYDEVLMDCLATELSGSVLERLVPPSPAGP